MLLGHILALAMFLVAVSGHGRVLHPVARGSMWRRGFNTRHNYDDHSLNCGGFWRQHSVNGGRCGICGDGWDEPRPRRHEIGGQFGQGIIVATYQSGQEFTATVEITVFHKGYWYFKICTDPSSGDQECFDKYPVELVSGGFNYYPPREGTFNVNYRLPEGLVCEHCVLQWRYVGGNNWGFCPNGGGRLGCGPQETFGACSDITIRASNSA